MFHIYAAIRDDIMGRVSAISSMVSGWRAFRDGKN
jgi:Ni/Fe-hydrogenase 1 B-type cytochrome subunit